MDEPDIFASGHKAASQRDFVEDMPDGHTRVVRMQDSHNLDVHGSANIMLIRILDLAERKIVLKSGAPTRF